MLRKRSAAHGNQRGMALVLTLTAVSFLVAITVQLFSTVNWQMQGAANIGDSIQLDAMTRSALNLARAALYADQQENTFDSLHDGWRVLDQERITSLMGTGRLSVVVDDLSGRLQVNALVSSNRDPNKRGPHEARQHELWLRLLTSGKLAVADSDQAEALLDALRDWIDSDDNERDKGAESGYYQGLNPPYSARNGPVSYPEELLLIRGMTRELFYGNEKYLGLDRFITVAGSDGKINLNSAPRELIEFMAPGIDAEAAGKVAEFRQEEVNRDALATPGWYKLASGFPGDVDISQELLTTKSQYFLVKATADNGGVVRTGTGVIFRDDNYEQQLLSWEVR
ncbi:MAG: type II secretion system minor pseudopilin GspK [Desulfobulbaceae bacterium]